MNICSWVWTLLVPIVWKFPLHLFTGNCQKKIQLRRGSFLKKLRSAIVLFSVF